MILERQEENGWGNSVVEMLAKDLQKTFPKMEGLSSRNLWRMRIFYLAYFEFLPLAVAEIGWTHNYLIIEKCKDPNERLFYIHQTKRYGWTKNVLIHQIENQSFQKTILSQQNTEFFSPLSQRPNPKTRQILLSFSPLPLLPICILGQKRSVQSRPYSFAASVSKCQLPAHPPQ